MMEDKSFVTFAVDAKLKEVYNQAINDAVRAVGGVDVEHDDYPINIIIKAIAAIKALRK